MSVFETCIHQMGKVVRQHYPDWTERSHSDPGITLLQLLAFLSEQLGLRGGIPERGHSHVLNAIAGLTRLLPPPEGVCKPFTRVRFFEGQLLTAGDFTAEQNYNRGKRRLHNKYLHGYGVVSGLDVQVNQNQVIVSPGVALDPQGEEIVVPCQTSITLHRQSKPVYVSALFSERDGDSVPTPQGSQHSRIEETFLLVAETNPSSLSVPLARLISSRGKWRVDKRFKPRRVKVR